MPEGGVMLEHLLRPWTPLTRTVGVHGVTGQPVPIEEGVEVYGNSRYTVFKRRITGDGLPTLIHLSIHDHERSTRHDWRDFQRIKNELVGPECEGVEVYPAESRLVDTSNEYHLWVIEEPGVRIGFGFEERMVVDKNPEAEALHGWRQRRLENR